MRVLLQTRMGHRPPASCPQPRQGSHAGRPGKALRWVRRAGCCHLSRLCSAAQLPTLQFPVSSEAPSSTPHPTPGTAQHTAPSREGMHISRDQLGGKGWGGSSSLGPWSCPLPRPTPTMPLPAFTFRSVPGVGGTLGHNQRSFPSWTSEVPPEGQLRRLRWRQPPLGRAV